MRSDVLASLALGFGLLLSACQRGDPTPSGGASESTFGLARGPESQTDFDCTLSQTQLDQILDSGLPWKTLETLETSAPSLRSGQDSLPERGDATVAQSSLPSCSPTVLRLLEKGLLGDDQPSASKSHCLQIMKDRNGNIYAKPFLLPPENVAAFAQRAAAQWSGIGYVYYALSCLPPA